MPTKLVKNSYLVGKIDLHNLFWRENEENKGAETVKSPAPVYPGAGLFISSHSYAL